MVEFYVKGLKYGYLATSRQITDTDSCSQTEDSICLIFEFEITVDTGFKMVNGLDNDESLNEGIDRLKGKKSWLPEPSIRIY